MKKLYISAKRSLKSLMANFKHLKTPQFNLAFISSFVFLVFLGSANAQNCDQGLTNLAESPLTNSINYSSSPTTMGDEEILKFQIPLAVVKSEESDKKHRYEHKLHLPDGSSSIDTPSNIVRG